MEAGSCNLIRWLNRQGKSGKAVCVRMAMQTCSHQNMHNKVVFDSNSHASDSTLAGQICHPDRPNPPAMAELNEWKG